MSTIVKKKTYFSDSWLQNQEYSPWIKRCDNDDPEMIISQCACHLVWARKTDESNKFCQRLNGGEKERLEKLATAAMKNDLDILPQNRKARNMMIKSLYKG